MSKRVTINDVARVAWVSRQTVSRALNNKGEIDGSTKQQVLDAAQELGYRPSRFARGRVPVRVGFRTVATSNGVRLHARTASFAITFVPASERS